MNNPTGAWLEDLTQEELENRMADGAPVLLPCSGAGRLPACLPLKTWTVLARSIAQQVLARTDVLVAPVRTAGFAQANPQAHLEEAVAALRGVGANRLMVLQVCGIGAPAVGIAGTTPHRVTAESEDEAIAAMFALDPRSIRSALLPRECGAQAIQGERWLVRQVDAVLHGLTILAKR